MAALDAWSKGYVTSKSVAVGSTFMMLKAKLGAATLSKIEIALVNELLCKVLCHNLCCVIQSMYELGIEPAFDTDQHAISVTVLGAGCTTAVEQTAALGRAGIRLDGANIF